jgi:hypothetical protein
MMKFLDMSGPPLLTSGSQARHYYQNQPSQLDECINAVLD